MKILIELDVFSGRQNPSWTVENDEAKSLYQLLQNLSPKITTPPTDGLGYKGFNLTITEGDEKQNAHVYGNLVMFGTFGVKNFEDKNHAEQKLLQMAKEKGYGDILETMGIK